MMTKWRTTFDDWSVGIVLVMAVMADALSLFVR